MAKVRPTVLLRGLPWASFNVPANLTNRGTGNDGTSSRGTCTVRPGACGSAATGRCCACAPATPKHKKNTKPTPIHLTVRFMAPLLIFRSGRNSGFLLGQSGSLGAPTLGAQSNEAGRWPTRLAATLNFQI